MYKSWDSVKNPLHIIREEAGKKNRSQVSTPIFVQCLHVFHSKIPQYTYPWLWQLTWLQIRPSGFGFIPPKNKIPIVCGMLRIFAFTSHTTHCWMYTLKENELPPSKGKHHYILTSESQDKGCPVLTAVLALLLLYGVWLYTIQLTATSTLNFKTRVATEETWVCYKFRKITHFKTVSNLLFPCWQAACLWQTWVWELFHTLTYLGKI